MARLRLAGASGPPQIAPAAPSVAAKSSDSGSPDAAGALFSAAPLIEAVRSSGIVLNLFEPGVVRAYHRAMKAGEIDAYEADRLALRLLGQHPGAIWGWDEWHAAGVGDA